jgi:hypothetical protein
MATENKVADALLATLFSSSELDSNCESANVVDGLFAIARSMDRVAKALNRLGTGNAPTDMGAVEFLAVEVKSGLDSLAASVEQAARIRNDGS